MNDHIERWLHYYQSPNPPVKWRALRGLLQFTDPRLTPVLLEAFAFLTSLEAAETDAGIVDLPTPRYWLVKAMMRSADPALVEPMIANLAAPEMIARDFAFDVLGAVGDWRATGPVLGCLSSPERWIRHQAALTLLHLKDPSSIDAVRRYYEEHPEEDVNVHRFLELLLDHFGTHYRRHPY